MTLFSSSNVLNLFREHWNGFRNIHKSHQIHFTCCSKILKWIKWKKWKDLRYTFLTWSSNFHWISIHLFIRVWNVNLRKMWRKEPDRTQFQSMYCIKWSLNHIKWIYSSKKEDCTKPKGQYEAWGEKVLYEVTS